MNLQGVEPTMAAVPVERASNSPVDEVIYGQCAVNWLSIFREASAGD